MQLTFAQILRFTIWMKYLLDFIIIVANAIKFNYIKLFRLNSRFVIFGGEISILVDSLEIFITLHLIEFWPSVCS